MNSFFLDIKKKWNVIGNEIEMSSSLDIIKRNVLALIMPTSKPTLEFMIQLVSNTYFNYEWV